MKKIATVIYVILLVCVIGGVGALIYSFRDDIGDVINPKVKVEDFTFTAEFVKDKNGKFESVTKGRRVYFGDNINLYSSSTPTVYKMEFINNETSAIQTQTLPSGDGYVFNYLIVLAGESSVWNLVNTSDKQVTVDLYYTITDGNGLVADDLYYVKNGQVKVTDSEICVFKTDGAKIETTGENQDGEKYLGQPYKVSFVLDGNAACVMNSTKNRLALYGINFR